MSDARRCDICGNFYDIKLNEADGFAFFYTYNGTEHRCYDRIKDCCPDCIKAIKDIMNLRNKINEEDKND